MRANETKQQVRAHALWLAAAVFFAASCGDNAKKVEASTGKTGGAAGAEGDLGDTTNPDNPIEGQSLIDAKFKITVEAMGMGACNGEANLKLNAAFGKGTDAGAAKLLDLSGTVNCPLMGCKIDLGQMVGGAAGAPPGVEADPNPLVVKDGIMALKQLGAARFDPPRPFFPAFLSTKRDVLSGLGTSVSLTATSIAGDGKTGSGTVTLSMKQFGQPYDATEMGKTFEDTMVFELFTEGFDGMNKVAAVLFDRLQFALSLKPLALLHMEFEGPISDLMAAAPAGGGGCSAGGGPLAGIANASPIISIVKTLAMKIIKVKMKADLIEMKGIDENTDTSKGNDSLGEEIGGKKKSGSDSDSSSSAQDEGGDSDSGD